MKIQFSFSFWGGGAPAPDPLTRGSAPGPRWGLCPQTSVIGSRSAVAMSSPHCSEEIAATVRRHAVMSLSESSSVYDNKDAAGRDVSRVLHAL